MKLTNLLFCLGEKLSILMFSSSSTASAALSCVGEAGGANVRLGRSDVALG